MKIEEIKLKPGWLIKDVRRASKRMRQWNKVWNQARMNFSGQKNTDRKK